MSVENPVERAVDRGAVGIAKQVSRSFWGWAEHHHIDALAVLVVSLWLSVRVVEWAMDMPYDNNTYSGTDIAAIIAAVLTPWGLMQSFLFKFYVDLKGKNNKTEAKA